MASILLITPDSALQAFASQVLSSAGHHVMCVADSREAVRAALTTPVQVGVVDTLAADIPQTRELVEQATGPVPFVFISPIGSVRARLPLREGDRILTKPTPDHELSDAVAALSSAPDTKPATEFSGVTIDREGHRLLRGDRAVQLTPIEFRLLDHLMRLKGSIASTESLLTTVWGYAPGTGTSDVVRSHLKNLRAKLRDVSGRREVIETIPRRGYRLAG